MSISRIRNVRQATYHAVAFTLRNFICSKIQKYECSEACKCVTLCVRSIECKSKYREKHRPKHTTYNIHWTVRHDCMLNFA